MLISKALGIVAEIVRAAFIIGISVPLLYLAADWFLQMQTAVTFPPADAAEVAWAILTLAIAFFWVPLAVLIMYYLTPKATTEKYLKEPHFTVAEIVGRSIMSPLIHFPTIVFMAACTLPRSRMRRRGMEGLRDQVPRWYVWSSRIVWVGSIAHGALWILGGIGWWSYAYFTGLI